MLVVLPPSFDTPERGVDFGVAPGAGLLVAATAVSLTPETDGLNLPLIPAPETDAEGLCARAEVVIWRDILPGLKRVVPRA